MRPWSALEKRRRRAWVTTGMSAPRGVADADVFVASNAPFNCEFIMDLPTSLLAIFPEVGCRTTYWHAELSRRKAIESEPNPMPLESPPTSIEETLSQPQRQFPALVGNGVRVKIEDCAARGAQEAICPQVGVVAKLRYALFKECQMVMLR